MGVIIGVFLVAMIIIILEVPLLWKKREKKELWVFSLLLLFGIVLSIAEGFGLNIPNPFDWVAFIFKPLSDLMMSLLE